MNTWQIIFLSVIIAVAAEEETPRWTGPFADHKLGHLVQDTPEVAAAKVYHTQAHNQIRAILPQLPPEEVDEEPVSIPEAPQHQPQSRQLVQPVVPSQVPQTRQVNVVPIPVPQVQQPEVPQIPHSRQLNMPQKLAEEIPRSSLGEVPEVEAARKAHIRALLEAVALSQRLGGDEASTVRPLMEVGTSRLRYGRTALRH